jgi:uncharacterized protein YaaW (UPF0174 family)
MKKEPMKAKSDEDLAAYLTHCDKETLAAAFELMNSIFSVESRDLRKYSEAENIFVASTPERKALAERAVERLKYFGSDSFAYAGRKLFRKDPGVTYREILKDVALMMNRELREPIDAPFGIGRLLRMFGIVKSSAIEIPRMGTARDYERVVVELLLADLIRSKSREELHEMFLECDLSNEEAKRAVREVTKSGSAGALLIILVRLLGKKAVKDIILAIVYEMIAKYLGREIAEKIIEQIGKKSTQKIFAAIVSGVGWVLIGYDVLTLAGPATRITVPTAAFLASMRTAENLEMEAFGHGPLRQFGADHQELLQEKGLKN